MGFLEKVLAPFQDPFIANNKDFGRGCSKKCGVTSLFSGNYGVEILSYRVFYGNNDRDNDNLV